MRARAVVAAAILVAASGLAACGVPRNESAVFVQADDVPFGLLERPTTTTTEPPPPTPAATEHLCFSREMQVVPVSRKVVTPPAPDAFVELLTTAPNEEEQAAGLRSALFSEGLVVAVSVAAGVARVDLSPGFQQGSGTDQVLAIAQIVCTMTSQAGVGQVSFTLGGTIVEVPRGDGSLTANVVTREDYATLLAPA